MDTIVSYAASPEDRPEEVGTKPGSDEEVTRKCRADEPFSALVFKTMADPYVGRLTLFKVFSGSLKSDSSVYVTQDKTEKFGQIYVMRGKKQENITEVFAGDIAAVANCSIPPQMTPLEKRQSRRPSPLISRNLITLAAAPKSSRRRGQDFFRSSKADGGRQDL